MKNLQKLFFALSLIFLMPSCSSDDEPKSIFGSWKYVGYIDNGAYTDVQDGDNCESRILTFNPDMTGNINIHDCDFGDQSVNFTWVRTENFTFIITFEGQTGQKAILTFSEEKDNLYIATVGQGDYSSVYTRL